MYFGYQKILSLFCKTEPSGSPVDGGDGDEEDVVGQQLFPDQLPQRGAPPKGRHYIYKTTRVSK